MSLGEGGVGVEASKPQLRHALELIATFKLPFAGPVRIGSINGKPAIEVCSFLGLDFRHSTNSRNYKLHGQHASASLVRAYRQREGC